MAKDPWDDPYEPDHLRRDHYILRKFQEIEQEKARQSFQQKPVQWLDPRMPPNHDPLSDLRKIQQTQRKTSFIIPPPPAEYLVTFIGGPLNATQRTILRKNLALDSLPENIFRVPGESSTRYFPDKEPEHILETFDYRLTFIPLDQTPFTDAQCVVAVFT